jgi:sugar O-acyltransferase (sialic acid O-acetyltransferase NeuD family)
LKDIVVVGAGGFGRETALMIHQIKSWNLLGFFDDGLKPGTKLSGVEVLGNITSLNEITHQLAVAIAIADPFTRSRIVASLTNKKLSFPILKHPTALMNQATNLIGKGCIVTAGVILTTEIFLGDFVIINLATTIGHDVHIADYTSIMPQCSISGNVKIGKKCLVGSGARILQGLSLGDESIVGAGAVVTKSFKEKSCLMGVPAKDYPDSLNNEQQSTSN